MNGMKPKSNKLQYSVYVLTFFYSVLPVIANAFSLVNRNFRGIVVEILGVVSILVPILFAVAFIVFFWGLSKFILSSDNKDDVEKGKNYMLWGILALFILVSFRAIIGLMSNELEFGSSAGVPTLP